MVCRILFSGGLRISPLAGLRWERRTFSSKDLPLFPALFSRELCVTSISSKKNIFFIAFVKLF
jgi:hypothetical protein